MIHQTNNVVDHLVSIGIDIVRFVALTVAAIIDRNHLVAVGKPFNDAGRAPVGSDAHCIAVNQNDRFTLTVNGVVDSYASRVEKLILTMNDGQEGEKQQQWREPRDLVEHVNSIGYSVRLVTQRGAFKSASSDFVQIVGNWEAIQSLSGRHMYETANLPHMASRR